MDSQAVPSVYQNTRCTFTTASIEPGDSLAKRRPAGSFRSKDFIHRVDVISSDCWTAAMEQLTQSTPIRYYRVKATLSQLFEKTFFTEHVQTGSISMLSEGSATSGNTFVLCKGKLNLYLDRETYERSGLSGKIDERNGNREMRSKWYVTYDLQSPSMQHGKRGFDRLLYGCRSISDQTLNWVCTLEISSEKPTTLGQLPYTEVLSKPVVSRHIETHRVITPTIPGLEDNGRCGQDTAAELYEWISLVRLQSPRILHKDSLDAYISRYSVPDCPPGNTRVGHISWDGLLSSSWVSTMASALMASCPEASWFAISATDAVAGGLGGKSEITVLKPPGQNSRFLMWDVKHK